MDTKNLRKIPIFEDFCNHKSQDKNKMNNTSLYEIRSVKSFRSYTKLLEEGAKALKKENKLRR